MDRSNEISPLTMIGRNGKILYYNADLVNILIITYMWRGTSFNQIMFELRTTPFLWQEYKIY